MSLRESVGLALTSLRANSMRSLLTLLGVIIGIASVITILTLGQSLKSQTAASLEQAGASDYTVQVQARPDPGTPENEAAGPPVADAVKDPDDRISAEMIDQLSAIFGDRITGVSVGDSSYVSGTMTAGGRTHATTLKGVNPDYLTLKNITLAQGRALSDDDVQGDRSVAVISPAAVTELFGGDARSALGQEIEFEGDQGFTSLVVVGVYADEATLVTAGLLREESQMFDINLLDGGEDFELVAAGSGGGGGGGGEETTEDPGPGEPGGPPAEAVETTYAGGQHAWSYGAPESSKKLVIIGNGSGSAGQQLWASISTAETALADTQVIWVDGVSTAADVDAILAAPHTYIIVPVAVPIGGPYAGQYISNLPGQSSPGTFWWGHGQELVGDDITEAIPHYIATYGG